MILGSSPRAWGTAESRVVRRRCHRFIPTCVGNRRGRAETNPRRPVHPHVRGEQSIFCLRSAMRSGSSPRAWGTVAPGYPPEQRSRFIPTCVGNSAAKASPLLLKTVHPHVRGEQCCEGVSASFENGSSPRAWGTGSLSMAAENAARFIPTCVGNSTWQVGRATCQAVHPHVRGEQ